MARAQLDRAVDAVTVTGKGKGKGVQPALGERVHEIRTATKKVRALLPLARGARRRGRGRAGDRADRRLRTVARMVSRFRDTETLVGTMDALLALMPSAHRPALARARNRLAIRLKKERDSFETRARPQDLARALRRARRKVERCFRGDGDWRVLRRAIESGYRRARRLMARAYRLQTGAAFHEWRKAVKTHLYQAQTLERGWPPERHGHLGALDQLGDLLGQEHDLTVLEETVETERALVPNQRARLRLLRLLVARRREIRDHARPLGARLFATKPLAVQRRLRAAILALSRV